MKKKAFRLIRAHTWGLLLLLHKFIAFTNPKSHPPITCFLIIWIFMQRAARLQNGICKTEILVYAHRQNDKIFNVDGSNLYCQLCYTILCRYLIKLLKVW